MCILAEAHTFALQIVSYMCKLNLGPRYARASLMGGYRHPANTNASLWRHLTIPGS